MADGATTSVSANTQLPTYLAPYVQDMLARGQALTGNSPFPQYGGQRVAGQSGLQTQSAAGLGQLGAGDMIAQGRDLVTQGANYTPNTESFGLGAAQQYMNPYQQSVTDIAKREATRDAGIMQTQNDAKAASAGAFGGSRQGVVDAELQRNLGTKLSDLESQGLNTAYQQAMAQYNADQNRQQQDRQYGSQADLKAGALQSEIGGKTFGLQQLAGQGEQQQQQKTLDTDYQTFLDRQKHPYDQLTFMRNLVNGFPGSSSTTTTTQTPQTSWVSDLGGVVSAGKSIWDAGSSAGWWAKGGVVGGLGNARVAELYGSLK